MKRGGMGWEVGGRFKREGTYIYPWPIHVDVWQKPTQYCKAIILQLKINKFNYKTTTKKHRWVNKWKKKKKAACNFCSTEFWGFVRGRMKLWSYLRRFNGLLTWGKLQILLSTRSRKCRWTPLAKQEACREPFPRLQAGERAWPNNCWRFTTQKPKPARWLIRKRLEVLPGH